MNRTAFLTRLSRRTWRERGLLAEAVLLLALSSLAIRLLPFKLVVKAIGSSRGHIEPDAGRRAEGMHDARWAVRAASPYLPWRIVCFQKGLALHVMLRRRGVPSLLHYGVGQKPERGLLAHVWVSVDGNILIGGEEAADFACLATFPPAPPAL